MEEGFPEGKYYTQNSGILSCPHLKLAKLRGATYSSASAQSCFSLIRPDLAAVSCHQFTYYRQEKLTSKMPNDPFICSSGVNTVPVLSSALEAATNCLHFFFFLVQIFNRQPGKRRSCPVGERWRYVGNHSAHCALLCDLALIVSGHSKATSHHRRRQNRQKMESRGGQHVALCLKK